MRVCSVRAAVLGTSTGEKRMSCLPCPQGAHSLMGETVNNLVIKQLKITIIYKGSKQCSGMKNNRTDFPDGALMDTSQGTVGARRVS